MIRKLSAFLALAATLVSGVVSGATEYFVSHAGTDDATHGTGRGPAAFRTLAYALTRATGAGDVVSVEASAEPYAMTATSLLAFDAAGGTIRGLGAKPEETVLDGACTYMGLQLAKAGSAVENLTFAHFASASGTPGALSLKNGATARACRFYACTNANFGCVFMESGSAAKPNVVTNCTFELCHSMVRGGALFADNSGAFGNRVVGSVFRRCSGKGSSTGTGGGAICAWKLALEDCTFEENWVDAGMGGALYVSMGCSVRNCRFVGNRAVTAGGAVNALFSETGQDGFVNCSFTGNTASRGGAVLARTGKASGLAIPFVACGFTNNVTTGAGGAGAIQYANGAATPAYDSEVAAGSLSGCSFAGNAAQNGPGGAISAPGGATLDGCRFEANACGTAGGALHAADRVRVTDCTFVSNGSEGDGGAVRATACVIVDSLFTNNVAGLSAAATGRGGAVFASTDAAVTNGTFLGNFARGGGGALAGSCPSGISASVFRGNGYSAAMSHARYLHDGKTGVPVSGGALYLGGGVTNVVVDCSFEGNCLTSYSGFGTALAFGFSDNTIEWLHLLRCRFLANRCTFDPDWTGLTPAMFSGSAVSALLGASGKVGLLVDRCLFADNVGGSGSGAFTASGNNSSGAFRSGSAVRNSVFIGNTMQSSRAPGQGGAASICYKVAVENCTFVDNVAGGAGGKSGALFLGGGAGDGLGTVANCLFVNNRDAAGSPDDIRTPASGYVAETVNHSAALTALPAGTGNVLLGTAPAFFAPDAYDYRLFLTNDCIGAGAVADWMTGAGDYDGRARLTAGKVDIGAYEGASFTNAWHWINKTSTTATWGSSAANWLEGTVPLTKGVTSRTNEVFYFEGDLSFQQTVVGDTTTYQIPTYHGAFVGSESHTVAVCAGDWNHRYAQLRDGSKFNGKIGSAYAGDAYGHGIWLLGGDPAHTTVVNNATTPFAPDFDVYKNSQAAVIRRMWDFGRYFLFRDYDMLYAHFANPNGVIRIDDNSGGITSLPEIRGKGTVIYGGRTYDAPALVGTPWVHLDASDASSLETVTEGERVHVARWKDVRGTGFAAQADGAKATPFLANDPKTGRTVVDFGGFSASAKSVSHSGPAGTLVFASGRRSDIVESFFVFRDAWVPLRYVGNSCDTQKNPLQGMLCLGAGEKQYFRRHCTWRNGSHNFNSGLFALTSYFMYDQGASGEMKYRDTVPMAAADVRLDGGNIGPQVSGLFCDAFHVVSVGCRKDLPVAGDRFACDPYGNIGGLALAEVILYTNALTSLERRRVNAYLRAKWQGAYDAADWDCALLKARQIANVGVKDGETFTVGEFWPRTLATVKKGGGTLEIARLRGADDDTQLRGENPVLQVQGGRVDFVETHEGSFTDAPERPPVDPDVWLDADYGVTTFKTNNVFGVKEVTYVSTWKDRRGTNRWGEVIVARKGNTRTTTACYPRLKVQALNGHNLIDCGTNSVAWNDYSWNEAYGPAGMVVTRDTTGADWQSVGDYFAVVVPFGPSLAWMTTSQFFPAAGVLVSDGQYSFGHPQNADWSVNGCRVNGANYGFKKGVPIVVHFRTRSADEGQTGCPSIAYMESGHGSGLLGGIWMGEMIYYHGRLSPEETRATEAYLMAKWLGKNHPDAVNAKKSRALTSVIYDKGVNAAMNVAGRDVEVKNHIQFTGGFTKGGPSALSSRTITGKVTAFDVEGGSLKTTASNIEDLLSSAALHVDASRFDTFTWADKENRRIDRWYDASGNGRYAKTPLNPVGTSPWGLTNAVYALSDGSLGLPAGKPYVDMLSSAAETAADINKASGMLWYNADGTQYKPTDAREWHVVFKMTIPGGSANVCVIGGPDYPTDDSLVPSSYRQGGFWSTCTRAKNGWKKTDDSVWHRNNSWLPNGADATTQYYVMTLQTTANVKPWSFGIDRYTCGRGGLRLCEAILFTGATNTTADAEVIHRHLLNKWKDLGEGDVSQVKLDSLRVATGAELELGVVNGRSVEVSTISGGGKVTIPSGTVFREDGFFDVAMTAPHTVGTLDFKGLLECPDKATVRFTVADGLTARDISGTYLILTADRFENLAAAQYWKLVAPTFAGGRLKPRLEVRAKGLYLNCRTGGFAIMFRKHREE